MKAKKQTITDAQANRMLKAIDAQSRNGKVSLLDFLAILTGDTRDRVARGLFAPQIHPTAFELD